MSTAAWLGALALDIVAGEPPAPAHPVVLAGRAIEALDQRAPRTVAAGALVVGLPALGAIALAKVLPWPLRLPLLKSSFALRELLDATARVERALETGSLAEARRAAARIVGRPTADLSAQHVASAAIESVSENLCDSYVAPLFWYGVAGLPGALAYRVVNTADAMIGHRTPRHELVGRIAARADDALGYVPARITALTLALCAPVVQGSVAASLRAIRDDGGRTASPNSGLSMAAAAGALGVTLEKVSHHRLGTGRSPAAADIGRARTLVLASAVLVTAAYALVRRRR
ncbi:MAG: cobalamin biosynthesis protein CobD [Chloroflexi bacterium]|nr:cobalamin biosynthesis protein CobD [Chloroflexota bacterium]